MIKLWFFVSLLSASVAVGQAAGNEEVYLFDLLPDPTIQPDNEKYPNYKFDVQQARDRAVDFVGRYIPEYSRLWNEAIGGPMGAANFGEFQVATQELMKTTNRLELVRALPIEYMKSELDNLAVNSLFPQIPEITSVPINEEQFPNRMTQMGPARDRAMAYIKAYAERMASEWQTIRGAPFPLPGLTLAINRATKKLLTSDLNNLNGDNPAMIRGEMQWAISSADWAGVILMSRLFKMRLSRIGLVTSDNQGGANQLSLLQKELEKIELQKSRKSNIAEYNSKAGIMKNIKALEARLDGLNIQIIILVLINVVGIRYWLRNIQSGKKL